MYKYVIYSMLLFLGIFSYAQVDLNHDKAHKSVVTNFSMRKDNIEELQKFDWNKVKKIFESNTPDQEITIAIIYNNSASIASNTTTQILDNFKLKFNAKTSEIENMSSKFKSFVAKVSELKQM